MATGTHRFRHTIDLPMPYNAGHLLEFLRSRAIPGVEVVSQTPEDWSYARSLRLPGGPAALRLTLHGSRVSVTGILTTTTDREHAVTAATSVLDLATDPAIVDDALSRDRGMHPLVSQRPGLRVPGAADPFELAIRAVVGQQISVGAASAACGVLTEHHGTDLPPELRTDQQLTHLFPSPESLAAADPNRLRMPRARGAAITNFCEQVATGRLDLRAEPERVRRDLLALRGFGPWTAGYVGMRACGDRDVLLDGDLIIRRSAERIGMPDNPRALAAYAERFSPWRSYVTMHLWAAYRG